MSNGSNTNTSGQSVAKIGLLPRGVLEKFRDFLGAAVRDLTLVLDDDASVAAIDYMGKAGSDKIADNAMEEIARRLIVTFEAAQAGNVVFQTTAPEDHSKVWWKTDPVSGVPIGSPLVWNAEAGAWLPVQTTASAYVPPKRRYTSVFAPAGQSQQTAKWEDQGSIQTTDYTVIIMPTTFINGNWGAAPGTFPGHFGYMLVGKAETECTFAFYGTPTGGASFEVEVVERVRN